MIWFYEECYIRFGVDNYNEEDLENKYFLFISKLKKIFSFNK